PRGRLAPAGRRQPPRQFQLSVVQTHAVMTGLLLKRLLYLVCFCCGMRLWQYYIGVRWEIYMLMLLAFAAGYAFWNLCRQRTPLPVRALRAPFVWLVGIFVISGLTFFMINFDLAPI